MGKSSTRRMDGRPSWAASPATRASMQSNRPRDTKPEKALRSAVHALGLRFRVSTRPLPSVRRTADLVFTRVHLAVFLDGCFWHGCPEHHILSATNTAYWTDKLETNRRRDRQTDQWLREAGWEVVRVWEHEDPTTAALRVREVYDRLSKEIEEARAERASARRRQDLQGS
ncbi:very short patch repair endonuclease [Streptomyces fradiae]|uniref:very short patch repair endonuclease n=1 Tax=Streptomyces fradiae TaxID=1906 RepID=UPI0029429866|nr:very short patch repair endonuclease [Streptomyces fradiae]WOI59367.1 very short patch repair endonuclease [Streptomyces fradiae]